MYVGRKEVVVFHVMLFAFLRRLVHCNLSNIQNAYSAASNRQYEQMFVLRRPYHWIRTAGRTHFPDGCYEFTENLICCWHASSIAIMSCVIMFHSVRNAMECALCVMTRKLNEHLQFSIRAFVFEKGFNTLPQQQLNTKKILIEIGG